MTTEHMAWAIVSFLVSIMCAFIWREITRKDMIEAQIKANREYHEKESAQTRADFTMTLDRITGRFDVSVQGLNATVAGLATAVGQLDATMAKEYASKEDLREAKAELRREFDTCREHCPNRRLEV